MGGGAYGKKANAQTIEYVFDGGTPVSVSSGVDFTVNVGTVTGTKLLRIYDPSFSGTPNDDAGKITIDGGLGSGGVLRILIAGTSQTWTTFPQTLMTEVGLRNLGVDTADGILVNDPDLLAKTRLMAYVSGDVRGIITVGQVRRIQAGNLDPETATGAVSASLTSVGANIPGGETTPAESAMAFVVSGNSISGTIKAELGNIDRVQVGPNTAAAGISGDIIAEAGAIKSIFSTGPIGNGTSTLMRISAANGIGQIRTAASDTGEILARDIEAEIVAHEAFLGSTPATLNDPASDGVLAILETAGDLHGTVHAANLTCDPDIASCSGRAGIFVNGVCYAPIEIDYIVNNSSIVARTFREPITIGRVLQGMVVATGDAETPDPEPEGWMDGAIPWITVGRGALPSGTGEQYSDFPVGLNGFVYSRTFPTGREDWFNPGTSVIDTVIHAEYAIGTASVRAMQHAKFQDTPPAIEAPTIGELIVDYFSTGSIWSGQPGIEGHEYSYAQVGTATIGCMRQGASLWVKAWGTLHITGNAPADGNPAGSDGNMFGSIHVPEVESAALIVIGAALADEGATDLNDTPDPRACHCAVKPDGSCQFAHWNTNELYLMELPRNPWWPFSGASGVPDRRGHVWIHENEKLLGQIIVNAANEIVTPHENLWTGAVQVGETTTGRPLIEVSPTPTDTEWESPYYTGQGIDLGGGSVALIPAHLHEEDCVPPAETNPANYPQILTSAFCGRLVREHPEDPDPNQPVTLDLYDGVYAALLAPSPVMVRLIGHETTPREDWMDVTITRTPGDPFSRKVKIEGRGHVYNIPGLYKITPVMPVDETADLTAMLCDGLLSSAGEVPVAPFEYYFVLVGDCDDNGIDDAEDIADDRALNGFPGTLDVWPLDGFIDNCYWGDCDADVNCDFALDGFDVETQEKAVGGDMTDYCAPDPDFNGDFALDGFDVEAIEIVVGGGPCPEMPN